MKLIFLRLPVNNNEAEYFPKFVYVPYRFEGVIFLFWEICTILTGVIEDLPVMVYVYNLATVTSCEFAKVRVRSATTIAAMAASVVNSIWLFCVHLGKTIKPRHLVHPDETSFRCNNNCCRVFCGSSILTVFVAAFSLPTTMNIESTLIQAVNGVTMAFYSLFLLTFCIWFQFCPRIV